MERSQNTSSLADQDEAILAALRRSYVAMICDALDRLGYRDQVILDPALKPLGTSRVVGRAFPVVVRATLTISEEPYSGEMRALEAVSPGEVLVYGGELTNAAIFGELFAYAAMGRGGVGAVVDGYVRDVSQLAELGYPVFSRGTSPLDTQGRAEVVSFGDETRCGGLVVRRGDYIAGDLDGIVVVPADVAQLVIESMPEKSRSETGAREDLKAGVNIRSVWERWGTF